MSPGPFRSTRETSTVTFIGRAPAIEGDRAIAWVLRAGACLTVALFVCSLVAELLPQGPTVVFWVDALRKGAVLVLVFTPVARVCLAGWMLGMQGEWRFSLYAAGVLLLLAVATGASLA